jgi:hypothetical protein
MKISNPFKRKPGIDIEFECTACRHPFEQRVRWLYIDPGIVKRIQGQFESAEPHEFLIPERIICPHCQAVDQFEFAPSIFGHATTALLRGLVGGALDLDDPIQFVRFGLADGREMHPREALEMYTKQVAEQPDLPELRVKYANMLCSLGYREEAEAEYRTVLNQDPTNLDALLNLAALLIARDEEPEGHDYLRRLIACAGESSHPQRTEYVEVSQAVLDGDARIEGIDVHIHFAPTDPGKPLPSAISSPPPVRFEIPKTSKRKRKPKPKRKPKKRQGKQPPRN